MSIVDPGSSALKSFGLSCSYGSHWSNAGVQVSLTVKHGAYGAFS